MEKSYLESIQMIPGSTPGEKFNWIARAALSVPVSENDIPIPGDIPAPLRPLAELEAAKKLKRHDVIINALKSEDESLIHRAFQAKWLFDGTLSGTLDAGYFSENVLPQVSLKTRKKLIKVLSRYLGQKSSSPRQLGMNEKSKLAEEFFEAVTELYGVDQAMPLITACSDEFVLRTIQSRSILLSNRHLKIILRDKPTLAISYLKLAEPPCRLRGRTTCPVDICRFSDVLYKLIRKHLHDFVEIMEKHEKTQLCFKLSNKCSEIFLKNGKEYFKRKPKLYLPILQLKAIGKDLMTEIFPKLLPTDEADIRIGDIIGYLKYYPEEEKASLLLRSFQLVYNKNLLEQSDLITTDLLDILPTDERVREAEKKILEHGPVDAYDYVWTRYLPAPRAIRIIEREMIKTTDMDRRAELLIDDIRTCKINNDEHSLLEVLIYYEDKHKNEQNNFHFKVLQYITQAYRLHKLRDPHWQLITKVVRRLYIKNNFAVMGSLAITILEEAIYYEIIRNRPFDELLEQLLEKLVHSNKWTWNIIQDNREAEKCTLDAMLASVSKKYELIEDFMKDRSNERNVWLRNAQEILCKLVLSIYNYNLRHSKNQNKNQFERLSIKHYPWLETAVTNIINTPISCRMNHLNHLVATVKKEEPSFYAERYNKETIASIESGEALYLLKKNPQNILKNWESYLSYTATGNYCGQVRSFVRSTRWHNQIPLNFFERAIAEVVKARNVDYLNVLATLSDGAGFQKTIEPLLPKDLINIDNDSVNARQSYTFIMRTFQAIKIVNPPVALEFVGRFCEGSYLHLCMDALITTARKLPLPIVVPFAESLVRQRVSVRKHGIRLMVSTATKKQTADVLLEQMKTEKNVTMRFIIFRMIHTYFLRNQDLTRWRLMRECISLIGKDEVKLLSDLLNLHAIRDEFIGEYVEAYFEKITSLRNHGIRSADVRSRVNTILMVVDANVCSLLTDEFADDLVKRYMFDVEFEPSMPPMLYCIDAYLLPNEEKLDHRLKVFCDVFEDSVKLLWNKPHCEYPNYLSFNNAVNNLVDKLVQSSVRSKNNLKVLSRFFESYSSVLAPDDDPQSYLYLVFGIEYLKSSTGYEFGRNLGQRVPELERTFTSMYVPTIAKTLQTFLNFVYPEVAKATYRTHTASGLIESKVMESYVISAYLLTPVHYVDAQTHQQYRSLTAQLREIQNPCIKSILNHHMNTLALKYCKYDNVAIQAYSS